MFVFCNRGFANVYNCTSLVTSARGASVHVSHLIWMKKKETHRASDVHVYNLSAITP